MATIEEFYKALEAADAAGNEEDARELAKAIEALQAQQQPQGFNPAERTGETIDPSSLSKNRDWLEASRIHYRNTEGKEFEGTEQELADFGLDTMGWFNYNMPAMAIDAARIQYAPEDHKKAFLYLMETYDELGYSWDGVWRFVKGAALDPTNLPIAATALGTFGISAAGKAGAQQATKMTVKELLKASGRTALVGGIEGAMYGGAQSVARQSVQVAGGARDEISTGQVLKDAAVGGAILAVGGSALDVGVNAFRQRKLPNAGDILPNTGQAAPTPGQALPEQAVTPSEMPPQASQEAVQAVSPTPGTQVAPGTNAVPEAPVVPKVSVTAADVIEAVKKAAPSGPASTTPVSRDALLAKAEGAYQALTRLGIKSADDALDVLDRTPLEPGQNTILKVAIQEAAQTASDAQASYSKVLLDRNAPQAERQAAQEALRRIDVLQETFSELDMRVSSPSGRDLGARAGKFLTTNRRGLSVNRILQNTFKVDPAKATPEQVTRAREEFIRIHDEWQNMARNSEEIKAIDRRIEEFRERGSLTDMLKLMSERDAVLANKTAQEATAQVGKSSTYEKFNEKYVRKVNEFVISTVFDPATFFVNAIPALIKTIANPALIAVNKGFGRAARAEMIQAYAVMGTHQRAAFNAARAAFKYERALLTGDFDRVLEQAPAISGLKGRVLRTFPRLLAATDEYFARINYQGFVTGQAAFEATEEGIQKGLQGDALQNFVKEAVDKAAKQAYAKDYDTVDVLDLLRQRGMDRGLSGAKLETWIKGELDNNADLFRQAVDQAGRDYTDDMLFKREFSGETKISQLARGYERLINDHPILRVAGQLFFRTPVRVFEEGIRLTPGFQLIAPGFRKDLLGQNGVAKQVKAQGQAMFGYGLTATTLALYASGRLTGGGPSDYKTRRELENAGWEPYTIRFSDGSSFSYRNLDPIATPLKIAANVLDRLSELEYRRAQGEKTDGEIARVAQYLQVAIGSGAQAIRDASLVTGVDQWMGLGDALLSDDETTMAKELEKILGKKLQLAVPAVVSGAQSIMSPNINDPVTIEQFVTSRLNPGSENVPKRYDVLGRPVLISNPYTSVIGPSITTKEMRRRGQSEDEQLVLQGMADLAVANNTSFAFPYKMPGVDLDLRRQMTSDGKETYYDRAVRYYRELDPTSALYPLFADGGAGGMGTDSGDGERILAARSIINDLRKAAFARLMSEELNLEEEFITRKIDEAEAAAGLRDVQSMPYR